MNTPNSRYIQRNTLIDKDEFLNGFYTTENYCARMKAHISKMKELGGDHLNDIKTYIDLMKANKECTNIPSPSGGSRRRRAGKHSKKHRKSKRSKKTKSRRH